MISDGLVDSLRTLWAPARNSRRDLCQTSCPKVRDAWSARSRPKSWELSCIKRKKFKLGISRVWSLGEPAICILSADNWRKFLRIQGTGPLGPGLDHQDHVDQECSTSCANFHTIHDFCMFLCILFSWNSSIAFRRDEKLKGIATRVWCRRVASAAKLMTFLLQGWWNHEMSTIRPQIITTQPIFWNNPVLQPEELQKWIIWRNFFGPIIVSLPDLIYFLINYYLIWAFYLIDQNKSTPHWQEGGREAAAHNFRNYLNIKKITGNFPVIT